MRERIGNCIRLKYSCVRNIDFEFLRATRRKLSKLVNCGDFNFKQIKILAWQRSIYLKLKDSIYSLMNEHKSDDIAGKIMMRYRPLLNYRPPDHYYSPGKFI